MTEELRLEIDGPIAVILIDRAAKKNAFTVAMWRRLADLAAAAAARGDVRVLRVEGADAGVFSAGADLAEFERMVTDRKLRAESHDAMTTAMSALAGFPKPTLAAIGGDCIGAGVALAAACDLRLAGASARFATTPAKIGLIYPDADLRRIEALTGAATLKRLLFTATPIDAAEARRIGLVEIVVEEADPRPAAAALAAGIAALSLPSLCRMKAVIDGAERPAAQARADFLAAYDSADFAEGLAAFHKRREPRF